MDYDLRIAVSWPGAASPPCRGTGISNQKMNDMKNYILLFAVAAACLAGGCGKDTFHDTGIANGVYDGTAWDYLRQGHGNWDSLVIMVRKAGLVDLLDGKDPDCPEMTVFGLTNLSIIQYLLRTTDTNGEQACRGVGELPDALCREILLSYVIPGKHVRTDFPHEVQGTLEGGRVYRTLNGLDLRVYRIKGSWQGMADIGADGIGFHFMASGHTGHVASGDIMTDNAVIHSLSTTFQMVDPVLPGTGLQAE